MIRQELCLHLHALGSRLPLGELDVIVVQKVHGYCLDLVAGEEAAGARVSPIPKRHALRVSRHELRLAPHCCIICLLAQLRKPQAVKGFRVGVQLRVHGDSLCGHADRRVRWDHEAV